MGVRGLTIQLLLIAAISTACGDRALPPANSPSDRPFAAFDRDDLLLTRLESPVSAPLTVGSVAGPGTIRSDDPTIVSIDSSGGLVAHRNGRVYLRTPEGGTRVLTVEIPVEPVTRLR